MFKYIFKYYFIQIYTTMYCLYLYIKYQDCLENMNIDSKKKECIELKKIYYEVCEKIQEF